MESGNGFMESVRSAPKKGSGDGKDNRESGNGGFAIVLKKHTDSDQRTKRRTMHGAMFFASLPVDFAYLYWFT